MAKVMNASIEKIVWDLVLDVSVGQPAVAAIGTQVLFEGLAADTKKLYQMPAAKRGEMAREVVGKIERFDLGPDPDWDEFVIDSIIAFAEKLLQEQKVAVVTDYLR